MIGAIGFAFVLLMACEPPTGITTTCVVNDNPPELGLDLYEDLSVGDDSLPYYDADGCSWRAYFPDGASAWSCPIPSKGALP